MGHDPILGREVSLCPILTYVAGTRPETAKTTQILEAAEMRTLRISNLTLFDREKSDNIERCAAFKK